MNARSAALRIINDVLKNKSFLNITMKHVLPKVKTPEDKRFAAALSCSVIENLFRIDYILQTFIKGKRVHSIVRNILRMGTCQILFFESVPTSAAVNESVKITEEVSKPNYKGFVNAVLRNVAKHIGSIEYPKDKIDFLSVFYSYPKWLCEKYVKEYGYNQAEAMLSYQGDHSLLGIRKNELRGAGIDLPPQFLHAQYLPDAYYLKNALAIDKDPYFEEGIITVQSEASMMCVRGADISSFYHVLDCCAAPGGKSAYAAQFAQNGNVLCMEIHAHRAELMKKTFARLGVENAEIEVRDASEHDNALDGRFDVVMLDAPCSALGLLYRKPDIKIHKTETDLEYLRLIQRKLLDSCCRYVKKGGTLLYSTCTVNRCENEDNVNAFLYDQPSFKLDSLAPFLPDIFNERAKDGMIQFFPYLDGIDGFFIARMKKNE